METTVRFTIEANVVWLEISVNDVVLVEEDQSAEDLDGD